MQATLVGARDVTHCGRQTRIGSAEEQSVLLTEEDAGSRGDKRGELRFFRPGERTRRIDAVKVRDPGAPILSKAVRQQSAWRKV